MKKLFMVLAATVICGACLFTSCKKDEDNDLKLEENIIGKWMMMDMNGQPLPTNDKAVFTFSSVTEAYMSASIQAHSELDNLWSLRTHYTVEISGSTVTLTNVVNEHQTIKVELVVSSINAAEMQATMKNTMVVDGHETSSPAMPMRFTKQTADHSAAILGTWQGHCTSEGSVFDDGQEHRWEYRADGSYVYYRHDGQAWVPYGDDFAEYFVDGNLLCTRWRNSGEQTENREWWEITIDGPRIHWTALRQNPDGTTFTATFEMEKVN